MPSDRNKRNADGPRQCGKNEARVRSPSARRLRTAPNGIALVGMLCLFASLGDARRWPAEGATRPWQAGQSWTRRLLQAGGAPTTPVLYEQVLRQTDRSSGSLVVDGGSVVVARVIQPPPPPPPRTLVPAATRSALSPEAIFVGIVFGTFVACCMGMFLIWRSMENTDWSQVRERLSKWIGLPLSRQQETMVSTLNGDRTERAQPDAGAAETAATDIDIPSTGGQGVPRTASHSQLTAADASSADGRSTHAATAAPPLTDAQLGGNMDDRHARGLLAAGTHPQRALTEPEVVGDASAAGVVGAAAAGGHAVGCSTGSLRLAAARLPGQWATSSDSSLGEEPAGSTQPAPLPAEGTAAASSAEGVAPARGA